MSIQPRLRNWARLVFLLGQNPITFIGAVLTTTAAVTLIVFWVYDFLIPSAPHPYIGILLFLILPAIFLVGLILIPIGIFLRRRRLVSTGELTQTIPNVDLRNAMVRRGLLLVAVATIVNIFIFGTASFRGIQYMDTSQFCGQTCHTVMSPEYTAYQNSAHSHVGCVECHIGPGAGSFVRAKLSGVRQVIAVARHTYSRPIHAPVKYMRPAREICGHCHWPERFIGDKILVETTYKDDEKNTPQKTVLVMKLGGASSPGPIAIHGAHENDAARIRYIAIDDQRQVIPVVDYTDAQGRTVEYVSSDIQATPQQLAAGEHRAMDCIDCHNRPAHAFELPENAVNRQIASGRISSELPFVRKKTVELLKAGYPDRESGSRQIKDALDAFYRANYPAIYDSHREQVHQAADAVAAIYLRNIFPQMNVSWGVDPNNLGHTDSPGCFRCHDGSHTSADGQTITNDCSACHDLLAVEEENPKILSDLSAK
jgi:hypothetical protein